MKVRLDEIATISSGKRPAKVSKQPTEECAVPVIGGGGVSGYTNRALFEEGVLITGRVGTLGKLFAPSYPCWPSDNTLVIRISGANVDGTYLRYAVELSIPQVAAMNRGAANPLITQGDIGRLSILLPPLPEQRAIARILGTLDDKIELNRRMNETLEAMAQALFKSWFVDFDPVVVNALKAGNSIPEKFAERAAHYRDNPDALGLPEHVLRLFPDRFRDSELGPIPEGWEVTEIKNCCTKVQNGGTPRKSQIEYWQPGTIPWLTSSEVRQTIIAETENMISELGFEKSSAKWLPKDSTVVALYGATAGQVALISLDLTTNQAVCGLIPKPFYRYFNYLHLKRSVRLLANLARGSAQQNISKRIVEMTKVVLPNKAIIKSFDQEISPVFDKWVANLLESRTLAALRDTLLPKLISGELRVPDIERVLERATP